MGAPPALPEERVPPDNFIEATQITGHLTAPLSIPTDVVTPSCSTFDTGEDHLSSNSPLLLDDQGTAAKFLALKQVVAAQIINPLSIPGMVQAELKSPAGVAAHLTGLNRTTASHTDALSLLFNQISRSKNLLLQCINSTTAAQDALVD
jgi:hypothetical protein